MKLYKLLQAMDLRHSDKWDDYNHIEITFVDGEDCEVVPNTLRSILRFADCYVNSVDVDMRDGNAIICIIITNEVEAPASIETLRHYTHLCE